MFPGRLSVSRTFGDIEAKDIELGGMEGVVIAEPEIKVFKVTKELDFILMASDGIFDKLDNEEVREISWNGINKAIDSMTTSSLNDVCLGAVDSVMSRSLLKKTNDNISVVLIAFNNFGMDS